MRPETALYVGQVRHRRLRPVAHGFQFPLFLAFLDIDRLPEDLRVSRLVSYGRWNWASFRQEDHLGDPSLPLRERLRLDALEQGLRLPEGPIFLLTHLRYLGYCFNPVSYFYCHDPEGALRFVLAEVHNTFGERHGYWMDAATATRGKGALGFDVPKAFHVSPFLSMDCRYRWTFTEPGDGLRVRVAEFEAGAFTFQADLDLVRLPWTAASIRGTLFRFPWMTLQVILAIHWEALWLWIKRVPVFTHPGRAPSPPA